MSLQPWWHYSPCAGKEANPRTLQGITRNAVLARGVRWPGDTLASVQLRLERLTREKRAAFACACARRAVAYRSAVQPAARSAQQHANRALDIIAAHVDQADASAIDTMQRMLLCGERELRDPNLRSVDYPRTIFGAFEAVQHALSEALSGSGTEAHLAASAAISAVWSFGHSTETGHDWTATAARTADELSHPAVQHELFLVVAMLDWLETHPARPLCSRHGDDYFERYVRDAEQTASGSPDVDDGGATDEDSQVRPAPWDVVSEPEWVWCEQPIVSQSSRENGHASARDRFGGLPVGLPSEHWPECESCDRPMTLLAQLRHRDGTLNVGLGNTLFVFLCQNASECDFWDELSGANACFVLPDSELNDESTTPPEGATIAPEFPVVGWKRFQDEPDPFGGCKAGGSPLWRQEPSPAGPDYRFVLQLEEELQVASPKSGSSSAHSWEVNLCAGGRVYVYAPRTPEEDESGLVMLQR